MTVLTLNLILAIHTGFAGQDFGNVAKDPKMTLIYAEVNPLDSIVGKTGLAFKKKVEEFSGGSIIIDIRAGGILGNETEILDTMLAGETSIHMIRISAFLLTSFGCVKSKLLSIPYTFANREHFWNYANSDLAKEILAEPEIVGLGVRGVFYGEEGFRHFFTKTPVNSIEDLNGLMLRISNDPVMTGMVRSLNATPTFVRYKELYSALKTQEVDGAEQPIANYKSKEFYKVAPNIILDGHTLGAIQVVMNVATWNRLTENQQKAITAAGAYAQDFNAKLSQNTENEILEMLKAEGVKIVEVKDNAPWAKACKKIIEKNTSGQIELYQQILDMK